MNKNYIFTIVIAVATGGAGFFGGMKYQESRVPKIGQLRIGENGSMMFRNDQSGNFRGRGMNGFLPVTGEISDLDEKSMTVKLPDGSSKVVIIAESTKINTSNEISKSELKTGIKVSAFGTANPDGSITAQTIQLSSAQKGPSN